MKRTMIAVFLILALLLTSSTLPCFAGNELVQRIIERIGEAKKNLALNSDPFEGFCASANQRLSFRTGPNTAYVELFTMPQSTQVEVISMEEGNDVIWVLCRFRKDGNVYYGYTGLKRFNLSEHDLPWSDFRYSVAKACFEMGVYSAPYGDGVSRGRIIAGELARVLELCDGYAFIEFYDASNKAMSRGWVPHEDLDDYEYDSAFMNQESNVYANASSNSSKIGRVGRYEIVGWSGVENGYAEIVFYSASAKTLLSGFVPYERLATSFA